MVFILKTKTEIKAGDIDFTSDHIEFYLLPQLPKLAVKTGRTIWLNEKVIFNLE